jgi:hypothetical protein
LSYALTKNGLSNRNRSALDSSVTVMVVLLIDPVKIADEGANKPCVPIRIVHDVDVHPVIYNAYLTRESVFI